jgi:hypothetical protein
VLADCYISCDGSVNLRCCSTCCSARPVCCSVCFLVQLVKLNDPLPARLSTALQREEPTVDSSTEATEAAAESTEEPAAAAAGSSSLSEPDDFPEHGLVMSYQPPSSSAMQTPADVAQRVLPLLLYHPPTYRCAHACSHHFESLH